mmetsp:Transcript_3150/g.4952  ORF Transcript_3150/g.4952 Transcript_3150/m.4952 type:complete len:105 (+) Transcript_3150:278-592(+)
MICPIDAALRSIFSLASYIWGKIFVDYTYTFAIFLLGDCVRIIDRSQIDHEPLFHVCNMIRVYNEFSYFSNVLRSFFNCAQDYDEQDLSATLDRTDIITRQNLP